MAKPMKTLDSTSFPGPLPWLGGWAPPPSQGKGPGNEVTLDLHYPMIQFLIRAIIFQCSMLYHTEFDFL